MLFSVICASTNGWANNRYAGDLRRHRAHNDVTVMRCIYCTDIHHVDMSDDITWDMTEIVAIGRKKWHITSGNNCVSAACGSRIGLRDVLSVHVSISRHIMMTSSKGNTFRGTGPLCGEFTGHWLIPPSNKPVTQSSFVFLFDLRLNKRLSKQSGRRLFETPSRSLWRHYNVYLCLVLPSV